MQLGRSHVLAVLLSAQALVAERLAAMGAAAAGRGGSGDRDAPRAARATGRVPQSIAKMLAQVDAEEPGAKAPRLSDWERFC